MLYTGRVDVSSGVLNVRSAPGGEIVDTLENGEEVEVLADEGAWLSIVYHEGKAGYASKVYICFARAKQATALVIEDQEGKAVRMEGGITIRVSDSLID